ncbi:MAG TPA: ATP-dependent helicase HrpB [Rhodopila sp.]|uniref:ATP-dependent helicase HrpB n=1 Tax=Rhodopila sp. TaxID=2480087 RepID=UPI002BC041F4|nr:ATP-dependent helicase HrpB [Rhodopila sp.]HVY17014.1 ATP-dependent helicase HrpB [Rhodopila sp.]
MPLPTLPVSDALPALLATLATGRNAVLVAPPGAGKTTIVPLALLEAERDPDRRILMLEPRRLATRAAATRMASLIGQQVGGTVGFQTRLEGARSVETRVEVITEGLLLRRLQADPGLEGVGTVILDEVHERSLESDLGLALCLDLQRMLRPDLRLLAMSATADGARLSGMMNAAVIESEGRMFPVSIEQAKRDIAHIRDLPDAVARAIREALAAHQGDVLAFLPGMAEIRRTQSALDRCGALVLPLHGDLPPAEQDRALRPAETRRVVLATSIAETSLTVPGVRIVVDGGWRRTPRLDPATGLTRLTTVRISRAAADQRAGRAGREAPGVAIRVWSQAQHRGLPPFDRPEILEAELSGLVLECAAWGTPPGALAFQDPPPSGALAAGAALLKELGALDEQDRITQAGRDMVRIGGHPRLAAMMLAAASPGEAALAADLAALLEERDPLRRADAPADIGLRMNAIAFGADDADRGALHRIRQTAEQYRRRMRVPRGTQADGEPGALLAAAFPDRIGQRRGEPGSFRLSGGGSARMPVTDPLAKANLLVAAALELKAASRIRLAAPLDPDHLPPVLAERVTEQVESGFDPVTGGVLSRRRQRLGTLILSDRMEQADPATLAAALADAVAAQDLRPLPWTDTTRQLQARVALMRDLEPEAGWPDLSDAALKAGIRDWLPPYLSGLTRLADLSKLDLHAILRGLMAWEMTARLDRALPTHLPLEGGRALIDYTEQPPIASAKAQAFYGMAATPLLAEGRVTLRLALLSPAGRPIAITADLAGFWKNAWADARRDMRGRYPKHNWPENGANPG